MNKTILALAIFAFCVTPGVLSSEAGGNGERELSSLTDAFNNLLKQYLNSTNSTKIINSTTSTPIINNTTTTPVINTTQPINTTSPTSPTPVVNTTQPINNTSPTSPTPVVNTTQPINTTSPTSPTNTTNTTTTPTPTPAWYAKNDVNMKTLPDDCLRIHNQERVKVGVANLTWSTDLQTSAQAWAENMAQNGFRHSGRSGENIASSTYSTSTLSRLLGLWTKEQGWFIQGCTYPKCSSTSSEVGHYTQMVWAKTTQVGCGFAPGVNKGYNYLCCQYSRAGNVIGQTVYPYPIPTA